MKEKRNSGIEIIGDVPWGTHFCQFYKTKNDLIEILVPYFKAGLENNEFCMWVTSKPLTEKGAGKALGKVLPDLDSYLKKGQIEIISHDKWYLKNGVFNSKRVLGGWLKKLEKAVSKGYDGLRLSGNTSWLEKSDWKDVTDYEEEVNKVIGKCKILTLCTYSLSKFKANEVIDVIRNHQFALIKREGMWELIESSEEALRESKGKYRSLFSNMTNGFAYHRVLLDDSGKPCDYVFLEINDAFESLTGLKREDVIGKRVTEVLPGIENDPADWIGIYGRIALTGEATNFENYSAALKKWYAVSAYSPAKGYFAATFEDITERKQREKELRKLNRTLRALSNSNQAMVRAESESDFLEEVCQIIVRDCGYAMVWIGFAENDLGKTVRPVAHAGFEEGYLETLKITWADTERGRGPTGAAIRTGKPSMCTNMLTDPRFAPWREQALQRGYASSLVLPLLADGQAFGAINIYSRQPDPFSVDDLQLLTELANDLAYGITVIRLRRSRQQAEEALLKAKDGLELRVQQRTAELAEANEELEDRITELNLAREVLIDQSRQVEAFFKHSINPLVFLDRDFNFIRVNAAYAKVCRRDISEFPGHNHFEFYPHEENEAIFKQVVKTKRPYQAIAKPFSFPDYPEWGVTYWNWALTPLLNDKGDVESLVFSLEDVTDRKKAEQAAEAERQRFNDVMEMLPAYVVLLAPDYHVPFANRFFRERFGESHGRRCFEYLFGRSEPCEICETYTVLKTNAPHHWEWTGPDGRNYDIFDFPFTDTDGSPLIMEMGIDITDRKRAEGELEESERKYRMLIEQASDGITLLDRQLNVVDANPATCQITGFSHEELLGINATNLIPPEDLAANPLPLDKVLAGETVVIERRLLRKDGNLVDVEVSAKMLENGMIQTITRDITERKETENRTHITNVLLELFSKTSLRKEYLDSVVQVLRDWSGCCCVGIRIVNNEGYIPYESFTGFSHEFWKLENMLSIHKDACACIRVITGKHEPPDMSAVTPNGSFRLDNSIEFLNRLTDQEKARFRGNCIRSGFMSIAIIPVRYRGETLGAIHMADEKQGMVPVKKIQFIEEMAPLIGEAVHRFNTEEKLRRAHDDLEIRVTERTSELTTANTLLEAEVIERRKIEEDLRKMTDELARSNADLKQFAYAASHDLQEPLRVIAGFVKLLAKRYSGRLDSNADEFIGHTVEGVKRMQMLIRDLLEYSQLGTKGKALKLVDSTSAVDQAISNLEVSIEESGAVVTHDALPTVMADAPQLSRLFQNLIGNALKFRAAEPPEIHVSAVRKGNEWVFSVTDNGIGMDPKYTERIFVIFQRLHTMTEYPGTGIGLAICKKIVERYGGRIWVESEPAKGSTFYFTVPIIE